MSEQQRWHDADPVIALAVDLMRKADKAVQEFCAEHIIEQVKASGKLIGSKSLNEKFQLFWRRWQDDSKPMFDAMEYFKLADPVLQKQIALNLTSYIRGLEDNSIN